MKARNVFLLGVTAAAISTANIANAVVGQNDIDAARLITLPFDEVFDNTGLAPNSELSVDNDSNSYWPADICEQTGGGYMHYKYKPTEDQTINIIASGDDAMIAVINADDGTCLHEQDNDNLNYFTASDTDNDGVLEYDTDDSGNYIPKSVDDPEWYVGEAPHWYQEKYFFESGSCWHQCSENTTDDVVLTANTTYIIQIKSYDPGKNYPSDVYEEEDDSRSPIFVSMAVGETGAAEERPTPSTSVPVPTLPLFGFGILISLLGLFGLRKLSQ